MTIYRIFAILTTASVMSASLAQTKHRVVVDLFSAGPDAYLSTLGNIENLQKALGDNPAQVEVVCYGKGIDMILNHNNPLTARIEKLHKAGIAFSACRNTLNHRHISKDQIFPFVVVVDAGIAEVMRKEEAGWSYLRR